MNFGQLKSKVADWLNRSDLTAQIPDFINMAMHELEREWNYKLMESPFSQTTNATYLTLPARYKETKWLKFIDANSKYQVLQKKSSDYALSAFPNLTGDTRPPEIFCVYSGQFLLRPTPDLEYSYEGVTYVYSVDLVADDDSNNWTVSYWECLLFGALVQAGIFMKDDTLVKYWQPFYVNAYTSLRNAETKEEYGGSGAQGASAYVV